MGRIKSTLIKRTTRKILEKYPGRFSADFESNKKELPNIAEIRSKKLRNSVAGYLARLVRRSQK